MGRDELSRAVEVAWGDQGWDGRSVWVEASSGRGGQGRVVGSGIGVGREGSGRQERDDVASRGKGSQARVGMGRWVEGTCGGG